MTECVPQELLPIIPPSVQWLWVDGSGPKVRPCCLGRVAQVVEHAARLHAREACGPGRARASRCRYFEKSMTTATLQHWPARLVPPPRDEDRRAVIAADATVADHVVDRARDHHADRELAVVRAVGGIERAAAGVEADLALDRRASSAASARRSISPTAAMFRL